MPPPYEGRCLCGAVRYRVDGPLSAPHACHCRQCVRQSGHFVVASSAAKADLTIAEDGALRWYRSSAIARRGFCGTCGSALFWDDGGPEMSLNLGSVEDAGALRLERHIFVDEAPAYDDITDGLPQFAGYDTPMPDR